MEKESGIGNTFGTLDVPSGAVEDEVKFQVYSLGAKELNNGTDDNTTVVDPEVVKPPKVGKTTYSLFKKGMFCTDVMFDTVRFSISNWATTVSKSKHMNQKITRCNQNIVSKNQ